MSFPPVALARPGRASPSALEADLRLVQAQPGLLSFLATLDTPVAVLNPQRQIVFASEAFVAYRGLGVMASLVGQRMGEAFRCRHAQREPEGCGASEHCRVCGAHQSILDSRIAGRVTRECRLSSHDTTDGGALDLEVTSAPWELEGRVFTVLSLRDIGAEKRKRSLERIFFHDIVNTAGGLAGLLELLADYQDLNEGKDLVGLSQRSSQDILEEILVFEQLKTAEAGDLKVVLAVMPVAEVLAEVVGKLRFHRVSGGKQLETVVEEGLTEVSTDRLLLERVLINMVKNALEASPPGAKVVLGCRTTGGRPEFWVHNPGTIPDEVKLQIFQRSFSTKAPNRGLGTYSMRLLGETYLGGRVAFTSGAAGTEFTFTLPKGMP